MSRIEAGECEHMDMALTGKAILLYFAVEEKAICRSSYVKMLKEQMN